MRLIVSNVVTFVIFMATGDISLSSGATCPKPCRCLVFEGRNSVYCNRTSILFVPRGIPSNTQLLDLSWNSIMNVSKEDFADLPNLEVLNLAANNLDELVVTEDALKLPKLVSVDLSYNIFSDVPGFLPSQISNLSLFTNDFFEIKSNSFVNYQSLQNLDISNNYISKIHPQAFASTPNLQELDLSYNNLTDGSFPPNTFTDSTSLKRLSVRFNHLENRLPNLPASMENLDYVGNNLKHLPANSFSSLTNLKWLWFWKCQVSYFL